METPDLEVIIPSEDPTVATRPFVHLCDPTADTLPLHSTPLEPSISHEIPARFGIRYVSPVSGHSPGPLELPTSLHHQHHTNRPELYTFILCNYFFDFYIYFKYGSPLAPLTFFWKFCNYENNFVITILIS